jgi:hypothetical protein
MNFYAIHTAILPALLLFVLPFHFWRIRKANGLVVPRSPATDPEYPGPAVDAMPHLIVREVTAALVLIAVVLLIAMFYNAPLADQANPGLSPNPTKAPWYFMGIQEMLMHFHPVFSLLVMPSLLLLGLVSLPWFHNPASTAGVWFRSRKGRLTALIAVVVATSATVAGVLLDEFYFGTGRTGPSDVITNGLLPFAIIIGISAGFYFLMKKTFTANHGEAIQALFTLLVTAFVILTVIGVWFRGTGMQLMWAG